MAEQVLWEHIRGKQLGFKFTWQYQIDGAYVDFSCRSHRVVIEVDGESHDNKREEDQDRDKRLLDAGYLVLRFSNQDVLHHVDRVLKEIHQACEARPQWRY